MYSIQRKINIFKSFYFSLAKKRSRSRPKKSAPAPAQILYRLWLQPKNLGSDRLRTTVYNQRVHKVDDINQSINYSSAVSKLKDSYIYIIIVTLRNFSLSSRPESAQYFFNPDIDAARPGSLNTIKKEIF